MRPRPSTFQNPLGDVCSSNLFPYNNFRTLQAQWSYANSFSSITSALFPIQRSGRVSGSVEIPCKDRLSESLLPTLLSICFQSLPGCPDRNPFPFIHLHCCRGVGTP